jgi:GNAT superfamily N-acetyltransferase
VIDNYRIISARERDLRAIPGIEHAAAGLFPEAELPLAVRFRVTDTAILRRARQESRLWIAVSGRGKPVGFAYTSEVDGQAHLAEMDVHPQHGRRGIGTRLVDSAARWARENDYSQLTLITFRNLPWNAPFYRKLGFTDVSREAAGDEILSLLAEEATIGIDVARRVIMRLLL